MLGKVLIIVAVVAAMLMGVLLTRTTPTVAGATGVLAVFILAYVLALCVLTFFVWGLSFALSKIDRGLALGRPPERMSLKRAYYFASVLALAPVIIVGMQSVGGVGVYEFGLVLLLITVGCIYVAKRAG